MKTFHFMAILGICIALQGYAQKNKKKNKEETILSTRIDSVNYSLGINIGSTVKSQGFEEADIHLISQGILAGMANDTSLINQKEAATIINVYFRKKYMEKLKANEIKSNKWMEENKSKEGVITTESGLQYLVMQPGTGATPGPEDKVRVHYHGTLTDGTVFDSSVERGEPIEFPVNGVIQGWQEALQMMKVGAKWRLFIPPALGYGDKGAGQTIGPNEVLIFDVELLDIVKE